MIFIDADTGDEIAPYVCVSPEDIPVLVEFLSRVESMAAAAEPGSAPECFRVDIGDCQVLVAVLRTRDDIVDLSGMA